MSAAHTISFEQEFQYREIPGLGMLPAIVVGLIGPSGQDDFPAIIDTGATYSLFNGIRARAIGLELSEGRSEYLTGLSGQLPARIHRVTLELLGHRFVCEVAFSEQAIRRELLGRNDLFEHIRLGFLEGSSLGYFHPTP